MFRFNFNLKRLTRARGAESETAQFGRDARRDWQAVFSAFLLLNLVSIGLNFFIYERINKGEFFLADKETPMTRGSMNRFELEKAAAFFEAKRLKFESLKNRPLSIPDPGPLITPKQ